jgi:hypothetical protein
MSAYCIRCGSYGMCNCQPSFEKLVEALELHDPLGKISHKIAGKCQEKNIKDIEK